MLSLAHGTCVIPDRMLISGALRAFSAGNAATSPGSVLAVLITGGF